MIISQTLLSTSAIKCTVRRAPRTHPRMFWDDYSTMVVEFKNAIMGGILLGSSLIFAAVSLML